MVARVYATNGTKVYIGPIAATTVDTVSEFAALSYVEIVGINQIGEFGDNANIINFEVIAESRTRKAKGTFNGGALNLTMALDDTDTGQQNLGLAFLNPNGYAIKVEFNDKLTTSGTNTIRYFRGKVTSYRIAAGGANDVVRRLGNIEVDSEIYTVAAT
jgi:opacity protein-like surface antigen